MIEHVVKMSGYVQCLNALECKIPDELAIDRVLQSLPPSYKGFVLNYNMQGMSKALSELFAMLKSTNLLTRCHSASFCLLCLFIAEKVKNESARKNLEKSQKFYNARRPREPEGESEGRHGINHEMSGKFCLNFLCYEFCCSMF